MEDLLEMVLSIGYVGSDVGIGRRELEQASRDLVRYLSEFPAQDLIDMEEVESWLENVVMYLEDEELINTMWDVCDKMYPGLVERVLCK